MVRPPVPVLRAEIPSLKALLSLAVSVVIVAGLYLGRDLLIPLTLAVLLSFILSPLTRLLRALRLGRVLSVLLSVTLALGVVLAVSGLIGAQVADLAGQASQYRTNIQRKIEAAGSRISSEVSRFGLQFGPVGGERNSTDQGNRAPSASAAADQKPMPVEVHQPDPTPIELAERILSPIASQVSTLAIVFVVAIFILLQRGDLRDRLIRLVGSRDLHRTTVAMDDAAERLSSYFLTQLAINAAFGLIIGIGLFFIGVPSPFLWGVVGMLLRFVPYVGAILAALLPLALAAAVDPGWTMLLWTLALYAVIEPLTGQVVEPVLYGHNTGLSPLAVVVAAIFWTWLWGPIGLILSTPITLCLVVLGRHVDRLEFLNVAFGDQPALTPVENFYQRLLAGDADEAHDQAELLLKEHSLSSYYDEVALKGLRLAENDLGRGVLGSEQIEQINETINALIHDLESEDDADSATDDAASSPNVEQEAAPRMDVPSVARQQRVTCWPSDSVVLCVAGRGPLDEPVSLMLSQLLTKNGLLTRTLPHDAVSRVNIARLDTAGVAMVCASCLEISGSPSHLRYLSKRLRHRLPDVPILVGFWPSEDALLKDERLLTTIGADYCAGSLRKAVEACCEAAHASPSAIMVERGRLQSPKAISIPG